MNPQALVQLNGAAQVLLEQAEKNEKDNQQVWEALYELVFGPYGIRAGQLDTGIPVDWYDPDTSYEEDVRAYLNALKEKAETYATLIA